jgi:hypothetical protein
MARMRAAIPARPARDTRLDIIRGLLQLTIFASHVMGSFITRKAARDGWAAGSADIYRRAWRLYRVHLLVFALYFALVLLAGATILPIIAAGCVVLALFARFLDRRRAVIRAVQPA